MRPIIKLMIYLLFTLISIFLFLYEPSFNLSGQHISAYQQYLNTRDFWTLITNVGGMALIVFFSLMILFGFRSRSRNKINE